MAAVAFKALFSFVGSNGAPFSVYCTVSDVNAEYYVAPDGNNDFLLPTDKGPYVYLKDLILAPAGGTDTTTGSIFLNGADTGIKVVNGANLATNLQRQFAQVPLKLPAGCRLRVKQNT